MNTPISQSAPAGLFAFERSYQAVLPELKALPAGDLVNVNLDIMSAVTTACGVIPELQALRPQIAQELPRFDLERFDRLHDYALAAGYAHTQHLVATDPTDNLQALRDEAVGLRETLLGDATILANRGFINGDALRDLRGPVGYKNAATDLQMLVNVLKANWEKIAGKCAITQQELQRGAELVEQLVQTLGLREQGPAEVAETADLRVRAFTLFLRGYDDARRAVIFLRWRERDADSIAPSLYAGRGGRRKESADTSETPKEPPAPEGATAPATGTPPAVATAAPPVTGPGVNSGGEGPFVA